MPPIPNMRGLHPCFVSINLASEIKPPHVAAVRLELDLERANLVAFSGSWVGAVQSVREHFDYAPLGNHVARLVGANEFVELGGVLRLLVAARAEHLLELALGAARFADAPHQLLLERLHIRVPAGDRIAGARAGLPDPPRAFLDVLPARGDAASLRLLFADLRPLLRRSEEFDLHLLQNRLEDFLLLVGAGVSQKMGDFVQLVPHLPNKRDPGGVAEGLRLREFEPRVLPERVPED